MRLLYLRLLLNGGCSEICVFFNEVSEFSHINLATAVFVVLVVAILELLFIPGLLLLGSLHDAHDEFAQVLLGDDSLALIVLNQAIFVVQVKDLLSELANFPFYFSFL